ncbi:MAG TPA: DegT/DnrJ/EryC1/StrS family aminotransferase [archaeon]|nr:DegT/DnrJ/EryC1/StrS family aminotransferase [archaeon]
MNTFQVVRDFEEAMAEFTGSPYAVAVESCSIALEMCCHYRKIEGRDIVIPRRTYPSVAAAIIRAGGRLTFKDDDTWQEKGHYSLVGTAITDSAKCISKDSAAGKHLTCLSFHARKCLPIGRGGMILCPSLTEANWFRTKRHDGRHDGVGLMEDKLSGIGWNALMTPEQAARGLTLMPNLKDVNISPPQDYPDLSQYKFFTEANR